MGGVDQDHPDRRPTELPPSLADVAVIIPALNEETSLPLVLADLPAVGRVIVVDNGSTDATARLAAEAGALVVREPRRGYGAACLRGLATIADLVAGGTTPPRVVVFVDGDYSDHVEGLPALVAPIFADTADFVLGSRLLGEREPGAMPPQSLFGNRLACFLMRHLFGGRYTDLGPFRAIAYPALLRLGMVDRNFGWTVEMQIKATRAGLRTLEVPVPYRRRIGRSKISGTLVGTLKAGGKILYVIGKYGWQGRPPRGHGT
jgi:glycosyltransferase involved in cell wall biosynthesis